MTDPEDYTDTAEWRRWSRHVRDELIPMIRGSALTMSIVPEGDPDVKVAVELGMSILLGKPIVLLVRPGVSVPPALARVADEVIEADLDDPRAGLAVAERMEEIVKRVAGDG